MAAKISKDELAVILKGISSKSDYDTMQEAIEKVADEYGIDLSEIEEDEGFELEELPTDSIEEDDMFYDSEENDGNW